MRFEENMDEYIHIDSVVLGWKHSGAWTLNQILRKYRPPPATIVDMTAGYQLFYKNIRNTTFNNTNGYKLIAGDIRNLPKLLIRGNVRAIPIKNNCADIVVFDPPFQSPKNRHSKWRHRDTTDRKEEVYQSIEQPDLEDMFEKVNLEFSRVLKPDGILIAKMMDRHEDGIFYPNHILLTNAFTKFKLHDIIIYRSIWARRNIHLPYAAKHHTYYMIFKRSKNWR